MASSQIRYNYDRECAKVVNLVIDGELDISHDYLGMAYHFQRDDVALPGLATFLIKSSDKHRRQAQKLMKLQNDRGGRNDLGKIKKPDSPEQKWGTAQKAMEKALGLEKLTNQYLWAMHKAAVTHGGTQLTQGNPPLMTGDPQLIGFIEAMLQDQMLSMKKFADHVTNLERVGTGLGVYLYDKTLATAEP